MDEAPFDARTWSSASAYFFGALKQRGSLRAAVSADPPAVVKRLYQALSFQPSTSSWKFNYHLNLGYYNRMTQVARKKVDAIDPSEYDAILQVGAWYDLTGLKAKPVVSYHDGSLATQLKSPHGTPQLSRAHLQRTLDYERRLYQRLDLLFCMSQWLADSFVKDNGVDQNRAISVGAGINLPHVREIQDKSYDAPRLLFVASDFERKGGRYLLEAFRLVREQVPGAELTIMGRPLAAPPPGVRCIGVIPPNTAEGIERRLDEYVRATAYVMPSLYEPFGISFVEAMAHKLPCIGTTICAMPEIIVHGETGSLVPPADAPRLAEAMVELLTDADRCRAYGEAGYRRYQERFTWSRVADRMCDAIATCLA